MGTSSWPAFLVCKDVSLLLIFSYNKFCVGFPLDILLILISMGNWGGVGFVGFFCFLVSFFFFSP